MRISKFISTVLYLMANISVVIITFDPGFMVSYIISMILGAALIVYITSAHFEEKAKNMEGFSLSPIFMRIVFMFAFVASIIFSGATSRHLAGFVLIPVNLFLGALISLGIIANVRDDEDY